MPELPEVETIKRELEKAVIGKKIAQVRVQAPLVVRQPSAEKFKAQLAGLTIQRVLRKAKILVLELSDGRALTVHLKMTGQLIFPGTAKASRVSFIFSDGSILDFNDQRMFGDLRLLDDWRTLPFIAGLGPEPFALTGAQFKAMLGSKKTKIKVLLLDQSFVSGIGNLYAAESLFRSRIRPERPANSLSGPETGALFREIIAVLNEAIDHHGSSVDAYVRLSGKPGDYIRFHKVYGREGKPCPVCKKPVKRIALGGRGTYFCPACQK